MLDKDTHRLLALFGDAQEHSFFETVKLGSILLKVSDRKLEKIFKRKLLENEWVSRCHKSWSPRLDFYKLTSKGDECFRATQIARISRGRHTDEQLNYFRNFDRSLEGKHGVAGMGEYLSEKAAGFREKYPELYG